MARFSVSAQSLGQTSALCKLAGDADDTGFEMLEEEFGKLLGAGVNALILDCSGLESLSSAALGSIVNCGRLLEARGGKLILALLRPANEGLLEMLNLKDVLVVAENLDAARKMLANTKTR